MFVNGNLLTHILAAECRRKVKFFACGSKTRELAADTIARVG